MAIELARLREGALRAMRVIGSAAYVEKCLCTYLIIMDQFCLEGDIFFLSEALLWL